MGEMSLSKPNHAIVCDPQMTWVANKFLEKQWWPLDTQEIKWLSNSTYKANMAPSLTRQNIQ